MENAKTASIKLEVAPSFRWLALALNCLVMTFFFMAVQLVATFGTVIMTDWKLNTAQFGMLVTMTFLSYALFNYFGGSWGAKIGTRNIVTIGIVIAIVSTVIWPFVHNYTVMLGVRFIQGISGGIFMGSVLGSAAVWFPARERGFTQGILLGFMGIGFVVDSALAPILLNAGYNWQNGSAMLIGIPGVIIGILYFLLFKDLAQLYPGVETIDDILPKTTGENTAAESSTNEYVQPETWEATIRSTKFWLAAVNIFANCFIVFTLGSYLPLLLANDMKLGPETVASVLAVTFFSTLIASPLGGLLSDKVFHSKRYPVIVIGFALCLVFCLWVPYASLGLLPFVLFVAYGSIPFVNGPFWCLPAELVRPAFAGRASGMLLFLGLLGGVIANPIVGSFVDMTGSNYIALYIFAAMSVLGLVTGLAIKK
ncbi:putative sulfoacetate transporter SauU [Pelotomaculum schinkii]|uniref:Putative sulfoacetate transporter SauU n=1 Tax=Pelotomaculum schinkii TaxID=78350 RepID=A0A4Y7RII1_9FIRM|nr:MFS transporter [Pelotomaculum schinkii]TEB08539.1 putative sulfoacetate transporter SauU [Pelotomaculum schinkii]